MYNTTEVQTLMMMMIIIIVIIDKNTIVSKAHRVCTSVLKKIRKYVP